MLTPEARAELEKQHYGVVGNHSAVKTCGWTKNMIRGKGGCYKLKFYGIMSNQCMQMSTSISCANRCVFCWRSYKAPVSKEWKWGVDDPDMILEGSLKSHRKQLTGFGGSPNANKNMYEQSKTVKHVALSLTGEPITYPRINELCKKFHSQGISTFIVTNSQFPDAIKTLIPITQLYCSVDAPTPELLKFIDKPAFEDYWERMLSCMDELAKKKHRTAIRLTAIKGMNMINPEKYAGIIKRGNPDFIEVKSYMHVGYARLRLSQENMPTHEETKQFGLSLLEFLSDYEYVHEHIPSCVILLAKKTFKKHTWIDFKKFFILFGSGEEFSTTDYLAKPPWLSANSPPLEESTRELDLD